LRELSRTLLIFRPFIYYLNEAIKKLPNVSTIVYRGSDEDVPSIFYSQRVYYVWNGFSSATSSEEVGKDLFGGQKGTLLIMKVQNGKDISPYSQFPREREIILQPNTYFVVKSTLSNTLKSLLDIPKRMLVYELEEVLEIHRKTDKQGYESEHEILHKYGVGYLIPDQNWKEMLGTIRSFDCSGDWTFEVNHDSDDVRYQVTLNHDKNKDSVTGVGVFRPQASIWSEPIPFELSGSVKGLLFKFVLDWLGWGKSNCTVLFDVSVGFHRFQGTFLQEQDNNKLGGRIQGYRSI